MTLEAVLIYQTGIPVPFTCADGAGIEKGAILKLTSPMTVATTAADNDIIIGIAAEEKIANDGKIKIAVHLEGVFRGVAGAAGVTVGLNIISDATAGDPNELVVAAGADEQFVGRALESATDLQTFMFILAPFNFDIA